MSTTTGTELEIIVTLAPRHDVDDETLETKMFEVLTIVEQHAVDLALGPVVSVNFDARSIELAFTAMTDRLSGAQTIVGQVMSVIEQHTDRDAFISAGTCAREPGSADTHTSWLAN